MSPRLLTSVQELLSDDFVFEEREERRAAQQRTAEDPRALEQPLLARFAIIPFVGAIELEEYRQQFERVKAEARELTQGLTESQFNWRPAPDQWSIEECL